MARRNVFLDNLFLFCDKFKFKLYYQAHPHVDVQNYKKVFERYKSRSTPLKLKLKEREVYMILILEKNICWHSTTALEGTLMKKEVAILLNSWKWTTLNFETNEKQINLVGRTTNELMNDYIKKFISKLMENLMKDFQEFWKNQLLNIRIITEIKRCFLFT